MGNIFNRCRNCFHWHKKTDEDVLGRCTSPKLVDMYAILGHEPPSTDMLVIHIDGYELEGAYPLTGPDFGCCHMDPTRREQA